MSIIVPSGRLIVGDKYFDTDARIVNFRDYPYWDATSESCKGTELEPHPTCENAPGGGQYPYNQPPNYTKSTKRYSPRPGVGLRPTYEQVRSMIKQFVIHLDNCSTADMCWRVLQNERGNSAHFLVDNDGTIYQTLDLALMGWHASKWNTYSIGVEICNWGDAWKNENFYKSGKFGPERRVAPVKINNHTFKAFDFTEQQYVQMKKLSRALLRIFPNLPPEYPQTSPGQQAWDTLPEPTTLAFSGYIGHYHLTAEKWDPGLFDFKAYCRDLRGQFVFPLFPRVPKKDEVAPAIPKQQSELKDAAGLLYAMNEKEAEAGYYPIGPWGEHRLWHGGIHLAKKAGDPVFAPFPGRLVAARMGPPTSIGSINFVLLRHQMTLDQELKVEFYSLYMHLADEQKVEGQADWVKRESKDGSGWKEKSKGKAGQVVLLDEPIEAGSVIGHVGTAGPAELAKGQIHFEIFSTAYLFGKVPNSPWNVADGSGSGRFCDLPGIVGGIDADGNGTLSKQELTNYGLGGGSAQNRFLVTLHVSEWTADPSWSEVLRASKDYKALKPADIDTLVNEQILPGLWWDAAAAHAKLPPDGMVYHYNPVTFVAWVNQRINDAASDAANQKKPDLADAKEVPKGVTSDKEGVGMRSEEISKEDPCNEKLGLKEMVEGYDWECKP